LLRQLLLLKVKVKQKGHVKLNHTNFLGYTKDENGTVDSKIFETGTSKIADKVCYDYQKLLTAVCSSMRRKFNRHKAAFLRLLFILYHHLGWRL